MIVDTSEVKAYTMHLAQVESRIVANGFHLVYKLTKYAHNKMQSYVKPKTSRTKGKLKRNINYKTGRKAGGAWGVAFVSTDVKYQFAAEYGFKTKKKNAIRGKPMMAVKLENWKQAKINSRLLSRLTKDGKLLFAVVSRGKYRGMFFTEKAFQATKKRADVQLKNTGNKIIRQLTITR